MLTREKADISFACGEGGGISISELGGKRRQKSSQLLAPLSRCVLTSCMLKPSPQRGILSQNYTEIHYLCPSTWHGLSFIQSIPKEHSPWTTPFSRKLEVEKEAKTVLRLLAKLWNTLIWTSGLLGWKSLLPRLKDQVFTTCHADITDHWDVFSCVFFGFSCSFWGFFKYLHIYIKDNFARSVQNTLERVTTYL